MRNALLRDRSIFVRRPSCLRAVAVYSVSVAAPLAIQMALTACKLEVPPFLTFFPAIAIATLLLGAKGGALVLTTAVLLCDYLFMSPEFGWALGANDLAVLLVFVAGGGLIVFTGQAARRSAQWVEAAAAREHELNAELKHRVNNNLAAIQGMTRQMSRSRPPPEEFYKKFSGRLSAMKEANSVLADTDWAYCDLPRLAERSLKAFQSQALIEIAGPACALPPASCVPLMLALHELAVKALTYGSLTASDGKARLEWEVVDDVLNLRWVEIGGPAVNKAESRGLGSRMLSAQQGLDSVRREFRRSGVVREIRIKGAHLS